MDPIIGGALIGAGSSLLGGLFGSSAQKKANETNIKLQREQLAWQERMANSEYQRGVQDLKAAGLNPMLAVTRGGGASTPNVSAAQVQPEDAMARGINSAGERMLLGLQMEQAKANIELTRANTLKTVEEANQGKITTGNTAERQRAEINLIKKRVEGEISRFQLTDQQRRQLVELLPGLIKQQQANIDLVEAQTNTATQEGKLKEAALPSAEADARMWSDFEDLYKSDQLAKIIMLIRSVLR